MFARFRNLFSKNKDDTDLEEDAGVSGENAGNYAETFDNVNGTSEESSKLEGLNLLKSIVESEQQGQNNGSVESSSAEPSTSLSEEVAELLKKRLSKDEGQVSVNVEENTSRHSNETEVPSENIDSNEVWENIEKVEENSQENEDLDNEPKHTDNEELSNLDQGNDLPNKSVDDSESTEEHNNFQEASAEKSCEVSDNKELENVSAQNESHEESSENTEISIEPIELFISEEEEESKSTLTEPTDVSVVNQEEEKILETSEVENVKETKEHIELYISESEEVSEPQESSIQNENSELSETENNEETQESLENEVTLETSNVDTHEQLENNSENPDNLQSHETEIESPETQSHETVIESPIVASSAQELNAHLENNTETNVLNSRENSPEFSESSKSLSQSSIKENQAYSTRPNLEQDLEDINVNTNSSIVVEDIPSEITTPSPTVDSTISGSSGSNTSTLDSATVNQMQDPSKIIVNPIDNNGLACNAINNKLNDIADVAESLDAVIRDVQENVQSVEVDSNPSPSDKKLGTLRSTSSEDWHSRSTEDDSFATASEGNFTLHSSSSFQTASGRTSSYISCDKNSFDASEADDSTYAFEMPELTSPLNMSFEGSEQSYLSAQPLNNGQDKERTPTKLSQSGSPNTPHLEDDQSSIADVEELHSESVTPTPEQHYDGYHVDSIPIESETELEVAGIVNAPSLEIITEHTLMPMSKTPEVSPSTSNNVCSNQNPLTNTHINSVNEDPDSNDQQEQESTNNKPNAAWRRSKYYENITKQTIKGFL